jgi:flagellar motility protein MotE (MotC chaperone)
MNSLLKYIAFSVAAIVLFAGSFLIFAALSGAPMHEVAVVGRFFQAPERTGEDAALAVHVPSDLVAEVEQDKRPSRQVLAEAATPLSAFLLQSPFSAQELSGLQKELKNRLESARRLQIELKQKLDDVGARELQLEERWIELEQIRNGLIEQDLELAQRQDELERDARTQGEREDASWTSMAKVFEEGKPKDLAKNLVMFEPDEAARILRALPETRASALIRELPRDRYLEFAEAYRRAEP